MCEVEKLKELEIIVELNCNEKSVFSQPQKSCDVHFYKFLELPKLFIKGEIVMEGFCKCK